MYPLSFLRIDDVAGLAGVLGIEELAALFDRGRIRGRLDRIPIEGWRLIRGQNVIGESGRFRVGHVELGHAPDERGPQRVGILEKLQQPVALDGAAFPGQVGRHVSAAAVDGVATEAVQIAHQPPGGAGRFVVAGGVSGDAQASGKSAGAIGLGQQSGNQARPPE